MTTPIRPSEATLIEVRQALQRTEMFRRQMSYTSTVDPGSTDDVSKGLPAGSIWTNTAKSIVWRSIVDTEDAAVWQRLIGVAHSEGGVAAISHGYILVTDANGDYIPVAVGSNGNVLTADSAETTGLKWSPHGEIHITLLAAGAAVSF